MADVLKITILRGGVIKTETDAVSEVNHLNAENFLSAIQDLAGGPTEQQHKSGLAHQHHHEHEHELE